MLGGRNKHLRLELLSTTLALVLDWEWREIFGIFLPTSLSVEDPFHECKTPDLGQPLPLAPLKWKVFLGGEGEESQDLAFLGGAIGIWEA